MCGHRVARLLFEASRPLTRLTLSLLVLLSILPAFAGAQELTPDDAQVIARETYIYGYPIVTNYKRMYAAAIDAEAGQYEGDFNTLVHRGHPIGPGENFVVTPNIDTLYSFLWLDLRAGPVVLSVPEMDGGRYYSIQLTDLLSQNFAYLGTRATGNKAGKYLVAGPDWTGDTPAGITKVIRCETQFASAIYRTQIRDSEDIVAAQKIQSQYAVVSLNQFLGKPAEEVAAVDWPQPDMQTPPGLSFYSTLNALLPFCPPHPSEKELVSRSKRIGVIPGAEFDASRFSPEIQQAMQLGLEEGDAAIAAAAEKLKVTEVIGSREAIGGDLLKRAVAARLGRFSNAKEEALYPLYLSDAEGNPLDGSVNNYVLRLGPKELPPVHAFWSLTLYEAATSTLAANSIDRYQINSSQLPSLTRAEDGSLSIYLQHASPGEDKTANWLPAPDGPFYLVMRLYWPKPAAFDGSWTPPLIWPQGTAMTTSAPKPEGAEAAEEVMPSVMVAEPKPEMVRPTIWGEPTEVQLLIYLVDVDELDSADQSFAASVYFDARWKNPLLRHKGPGPINRGLSEVWNPRLTIIGQQAAWKSYPDAVEIEPDGTVIHRQKVWGRFSQPLKLRDFPFDQQELSIHMVAAGLSEEQVKMVSLVNDVGRSSRIAEAFSLPDFDVISWEAVPRPYFPVKDELGVAGYEMRLQVRRQPTYYVLKVIIPLCLIVIMSWLPRWIAPEQSGTNIGISTSAFLTLVAYLFAITVLLPRVSYVTRMDRFILLSTLTVFAGLIQSVTNTVLVKNERQSLADKNDRVSRYIYPVLLVLILAVSFGI